MHINIFEKGFNYSQDGPGNRLVYHLQGCNMKCAWCANPEGMSVSPPVMIKNLNAELPDSLCPNNAVTNGVFDGAKCVECREQVCISHKSRNMYIKCTTYTVDELLCEIQNSKAMFFDGGGVTLTGGEVTLQFDGVKLLLTELKRLGIHTAMETNGSHPRLKELFELVDYLIMDVKHYNQEIHLRETGVQLDLVEHNLRLLSASGKEVLLRIPLISGINTSSEDMLSFIKMLKQYRTELFSIELLSYHEYGRDKWKQCGKNYTVQNGFVSSEVIYCFSDLLKNNRFHVINT